MNNKVKHLEMIQAIINRMAHNSFMIKGWSITLVIAMFVFIGNKIEYAFIPLLLFPILLFSGLDSYYLMLEKRYRELHNLTAQKLENEIDFQLLITKECKNKNTSFGKSLASPSIWMFYGSIIVVAIVVIILVLKNMGG